MLTLDLNLSSRPFKNDTLPWVGLGLAVVALTLLTIWNVRTYRQNSKWVADLQQQYSATRDELDLFDLRERGAQKGIEDYDLPALQLRADKANEVILWKAFSWTRLFNLLQEVLPNDVQMISIRPIFRPQGADQGRDDKLGGRVPVSVEGVSKTLKAFFAFERALLAHHNFDRVEPEGHTLSRTGALAFELKFLYAPGVVPAREEPAPEPESETDTKVADAGAAGPPREPAGEQAAGTGVVVESPAVANTGTALQAPAAPGAEDDTAAEGAEPRVAEGAAAIDTTPGATLDAEPKVKESAAAGATNPPATAGAQPKRPKPPGSGRRGKRRKTADDEKGGGQ